MSAPEAAAPLPPSVSVIVPVRDDAAGVREVIGRLAAQTVPRGQFEVVIGDDGSRPGALAGVETGDGWVRVIGGPPRTSYAARNRAAAAARGGVLAFCDSDCRPEPDWLEEGLAALEGADLVAGEVIFSTPARPTVWSLLTADMFLDQARNVLLSKAVTANLFVRRPVFEALGGFDPSLPSGGDYDFVRRAVAAGARLAHGPTAVVRHPTLDSFRAFVRKVFTVNRWAAARRARTGQGLKASAPVTLVPVLNVLLARRDALRPPWRLERRRLEACGLAPGRIDELRALAALYIVVPYVAALGRLRGTRDGRRRLTRDGPTASGGSVRHHERGPVGRDAGEAHAAGNLAAAQLEADPAGPAELDQEMFPVAALEHHPPAVDRDRRHGLRRLFGVEGRR